jgi:hypothetical protein
VSRDPPSPAAADTLRWATHIVIPTDWTPGQALAVFELLDQLRDAVASLSLDQIQTVRPELTKRTPGTHKQTNPEQAAPDFEASRGFPAFCGRDGLAGR